MRLNKGTRYDVWSLQLLGWSLGTRPEVDPNSSVPTMPEHGYAVEYYFSLEDDEYLGPDSFGVEPLFDPASIHELGPDE